MLRLTSFASSTAFTVSPLRSNDLDTRFDTDITQRCRGDHGAA